MADLLFAAGADFDAIRNGDYGSLDGLTANLPSSVLDTVNTGISDS